MYIGSWKIDDLVTFYANTHNPSNGSATDADAVPNYHVYEDQTATPLLTGTMSLLNGANTVGFYSKQITLSSANGFEKGRSYSVYIQAVVSNVTGTTHRYLQVEAEVDANAVSVPVTAGNVTGSVLGNVNGSVGSVVGNVNGSVGSVVAPVTAGNITGSVLGNVNGSVNSVASPVTVGTNNDKTGYSLSDPQSFNLIGNITGTITNVLNVVNPVVAGVVTGSVLGNVNGSVGSVVSPVGISTGTFLDAIADKVWDEPLAGHLAAGSAGNALNSAGAAGDPWSTLLPGSYTPGQAGHILVSRMPTGAVIVSSNQDKTGYFLGTPQSFDLIGNISGTLSNVLNVVNPVTAGNVTGSVFGNVNGSVNSVTNPVTVGTNNDKTGYSLSSPQVYDRIGNTSGTMTNVLNVVNPVVAGVVTGSVLGNVNGSVNSVSQPVGINTGTFISAIADGVWDEQLSGHQAAGSAGLALSSAGSAGDPWSTTLPGSYTPGQAGHILASRMPTGAVVVGANNDKTGYSLSTPQTFDLIGNISGTLSNVLNVVNPVVAGMVTGSVLGNVNGSVNSVTQPVGISTGSFINAVADQVWDETIAGHLNAGSTGEKLNSAGSAGDPWGTTLPGAYGEGTAGKILASRMPTGTVIVGANNDKTGYSLASPQSINIVGNISGTFVGNLSGSVGSVTDMGSTLLNKIADFILRRPLTSARVSSDGDAVTFRSILGAMSKLVNRWKITGTTLTVYSEDDTTSIGTQTLTGTAGADPITEINTD